MIEFYCRHCGARINGDANHRCPADTPPPALPKIGYSERIRDARFAAYIRHSDQWSFLFAGILAVIAFVGFTLYGAFNDEMDNPQALLIGVGIGSMFLLIAFFQSRGRKRSATWDGTVTEKSIRKKRTDNGTHLEYIVRIDQPNGKEHLLSAEDDDTMYASYRVGDAVRHHAGLNTYEKYDKTQDSALFCSACSALCDVYDTYCPYCGCPLLK